MSADTIHFPNLTMLREAIEHLATAEDLCGTGECEPEFATIRRAIYAHLERRNLSPE